MSHSAGQNVAGLQGVQIIRLAHPLRLGTRQPVKGLPVLVGVQPLDHKTGGTAYTGQYGDIPHGTALGTIGALGKGHHGLHPAKLKPKLALGIKRQRGSW